MKFCQAVEQNHKLLQIDLRGNDLDEYNPEIEKIKLYIERNKLGSGLEDRQEEVQIRLHYLNHLLK